MAYSEKLVGRIRQALAHLPDLEEKKMFGGLAFMVGGKICLTAGADRMMCRIDPAIHDTAIKREGCRTVVMKGREYRGYVYVSEDSLNTKAAFSHWVRLAIDFNKQITGTEKNKG
ncbi:MAG TPA: TfoX/Sxy family protein [Flavitalea sp.]|nr:TfoX/Sxy family protein [Flavitalea sp.]